MKEAWKKHKDLIILVVVGVLVSIPIWILLWCKVDKLIQSQLIVVLISITVYYAIQTRKLVERERIAFEDQLKKRDADYGEKKLQLFYTPLRYKLRDLKNEIDLESDIKIPVVKLLSEIAGLGLNYGYGMTKKLEEEVLSLLRILFVIKDIKKEDAEKLETWKKNVLTKMENVKNQLEKETKFIKEIINKVYRIFSEEKLEFIKDSSEKTE